MADRNLMQYHRLVLLTLLLPGLLASCASLQEGSPAAPAVQSDPVAATAEQAPPTTAPTPPVEIEYGSFSEEQLYQAIISELDAQQGDLETANERYFRLAFETRDIGIIRRASQFASVTGDINGLLQLGLLWTEVEPGSLEPHMMLSFQLLDAGRFEEAVNHMASVIELGGTIDFSAISARTQRLPAQRRASLIDNLRQLLALHPIESIQYAVVELLNQNQQTEQALMELQALRRTYGESPRAVFTESQLLQRLEMTDQALRVLRNGVRAYPEDRPLRFGYARLLIQQEDYRGAREQFQVLIEQDPEDFETVYSIALLDLETERFEAAAERFSRLISVGHRVNDAHFYLGYVYEQLEEFEQAIPHYRAVEIGSQNFVAAQQQATRFAIDLGRFDEAHQWLIDLSRGQPRLEVLFTNLEASLLMQIEQYQRAMSVLDEMLQRYPSDADLLFTRVLLYDRQNDMDSAERDLRRIIMLQPDDSRALNHLGYMLADRTTRFQEALELLERAISLAPDDPAIIDSLAWAQYKLGRYEESLENLRRAFAVFPDHEVASHLGEVLWVMGERQQAMDVWRDALEETPDSPIIQEAMDRLTP